MTHLPPQDPAPQTDAAALEALIALYDRTTEVLFG